MPSQIHPNERSYLFASLLQLFRRLGLDSLKNTLHHLGQAAFNMITPIVLRSVRPTYADSPRERLHAWHNFNRGITDVQLRNDGDREVYVYAVRHDDDFIVPLSLKLPPHGGTIEIRFTFQTSRRRFTWIIH